MSNSVARKIASAKTINAAQQSTDSIECGRHREATIYVTVTATSGTNPTLDLDVETSPDNTGWHKDSDIPQISSPVLPYYHPAYKLAGNIGRFIRINNPTAPGGSGSPSMTLDIWVVLKD